MLALALVGCDPDSGSTKASGPGPNGSYLFVSAPKYYFGTTNVGTTRTQTIEVANRGGDIYPINTLHVIGDNRDEFVSNFYGPVTLQPAQSIRIDITFQPVSDGRKFANLDIDFDTISQVSNAANQNEQIFYAARDLEHQQKYRAATRQYSDYIKGEPVVELNKRQAAIKLPVIKESATYGEGTDFRGYLAAMNARESGDLNSALTEIDQVLITEPDSFVADDALYLRGYIQLMDQKEYESAQSTMRQLRQDYPNTTYYDTALYSEALALQALGRTETATEILLDLRHKHTSVDVLGITLPKDNLLSRVWFDRSTQALEDIGAL